MLYFLAGILFYAIIMPFLEQCSSVAMTMLEKVKMEMLEEPEVKCNKIGFTAENTTEKED